MLCPVPSDTVGDVRDTRFVSLGLKLTLGMITVLSVVSAVVFVEVTGRERRGLVSAKETAAIMVADLFASSLVAPLDFGDAEAVDAEVKHLKTNRDLVYTGVWLGDRARPIAELGGDGTVARPSGGASTRVLDDHVELVRPVARGDGKSVGVALMRFSLARENAAYAEARRTTFLFALALALGTSLVLIAMTRRWIVSPLSNLVHAANRVGAGDGRARVEVVANDEIGRLGDAFNAMSAAIVDRETRLAAARRNLQEVLDNMGQAIVVFGPSGAIIGAHSRAATALLGDATNDGNVLDLFAGRRAGDPERRAFEDWLSLAFDVDDWEEIEALAPRDVVMTTAGAPPRALELLFRRMDDADGASRGDARRIMLIATDVTEKRQLVDDAASREARHQQQMAAMRRLVAGGGHVFVSFFEAATERIERCRVLLDGEGADLVRADLDQLFSHAHTVTGEARAFGLFELEAETRGLEAALSLLQESAGRGGAVPRAGARAALAPRLSAAQSALLEGRELFVRASPIGAAALEQITVQRGDVDALAELFTGEHSARAAIVERLASRPFGESLVNLREAVPAWADRLGKRAQLEVDGRDVMVPKRLARVLGPILTHLCRNAVAHGIETVDVREAAGKPVVGSIIVRCVAADGGPEIDVSDDGAGVDVDSLRARAKELGLADGDPVSLVFESGLSTAGRSDLAGLGVGLAAVRRDAREAGYVVVLSSDEGKGTRVVLRSAGPG